MISEMLTIDFLLVENIRSSREASPLETSPPDPITTEEAPATGT